MFSQAVVATESWN